MLAARQEGELPTGQEIQNHSRKDQISMNQRTDLAHGQLNGSDELSIVLIERAGSPPLIRIRWPDKPTICPPAQLDTTVAAAMRILANSVVELAAIRTWRRL
jgi:hypothetical protein